KKLSAVTMINEQVPVEEITRIFCTQRQQAFELHSLSVKKCVLGVQVLLSRVVLLKDP
ncbi:hypothetical protein HGM15179_001462, partial [Zosterops borbonicus]